MLSCEFVLKEITMHLNNLDHDKQKELHPAIYTIRELEPGNLYLDYKKERFDVDQDTYIRMINWVVIFWNDFNRYKTGISFRFLGYGSLDEDLFVCILMNYAIDNKMPVILVSTQISLKSINELSKLENYVICFDQYDYHKNPDNVAEIIKILEDRTNVRKMVIMTGKDKTKLPRVVLNRFTRIMYDIDYLKFILRFFKG